jgi:hypothetical protein
MPRVEEIIVVSVPRICVTDWVDVVIVDVVAPPTTMVLVTVVWTMDEVTMVNWVVLVVSPKVTWKVTGKSGIVKLHVYPT